jgi:hypothetical protein
MRNERREIDEAFGIGHSLPQPTHQMRGQPPDTRQLESQNAGVFSIYGN